MTATLYLELEDQATGANDGTWGDIADSNFGILEQAVARQAAVNTSGGTTILTSVQNRYAILRITGALVSDAIIQVRTAEKNWIFINQTTGNFSVTVKTLAQVVGVTLPVRRAVKLYCDGNNVLYARYPSIPYASAGGSADAITAKFDPPHSLIDLVNGTLWLVTAATANATATPTFNPDSTGAQIITKFGGLALVAGDIQGSGHKLLLAQKPSGVELLNPFTDASKFAVKNADNNFTAAQTTEVTNADTTQSVVIEALSHRSSAVPDAGFGIEIRGKLDNAINTLRNAGSLALTWVTATDALEDSRWEISTMTAGAAKAMIAYFRKGLVLGSPTAGDAKGVGSINLDNDYFRNGKAIAPAVLVKLSDNGISSANTGSTLTADADLVFAMAASKTYRFRAKVMANLIVGSAGFQFGITGPAIGAGTIRVSSEMIGVVSPAGASTILNNRLTAYGQIDSYVPASTARVTIDLTGVIANGANAGNFALTFAQVTPNASNLTIFAGSQMTWGEV